MTRSFRIPLALAGLTATAASLTACTGKEPEPEPEPDPFSFVGEWNLDRVTVTYEGDTYSVDYPYGDSDGSVAAEFDISASELNVVSYYTYTDGTAPYTYVDGPFAWAEDSQGRLSVSDYESQSFTCDGVGANGLECLITYGPDDTVAVEATRL